MRPFLLLILLLSGFAHGAEPELLEPEKAFQFAARIARPDAIEVRYRIAPGYYMYRDKFRFSVAPTEAKLGEAEPLGEQVDLQIEMTAFVGLTSQPVLAGEDEQGQEDGLQRHGHREEWKREGIERPNPVNYADVHDHPGTEPDNVKDEHRAAARGVGNPVADLLGFRTCEEERPLPALDRLHVLLDRRRTAWTGFPGQRWRRGGALLAASGATHAGLSACSR